MNRTDYLQTVDGQLNLYHKRQMRTIRTIIEDQPKSKKSISQKEKIRFQQQINSYLSKYRRKAYRSNVAVYFHFTVTEPNPPHLHTLVKNYMDLLCKPVEGSSIRRKRLILDDDKLVRALFVKYHLANGDSKPGIWIRIKSYKDFLEDVRLVKRIIDNDFTEDDWRYRYPRRSTYKGRRKPWDNKKHDMAHDAFEDLKDLRERKSSSIDLFGERVYLAMERMLIADAQKSILSTAGAQLGNYYALLNLASSGFSKDDSKNILNTFGDTYKHFMDIMPVCLDLSHIPLRNGDSSQFKQKIKECLKQLKLDYPILMPLLTQVSTLIFVTRPKYKIDFDYDNLARRIIPVVINEMKPPSSYWATLTDDDINSLALEDHALKRIKEISGIRYTVHDYQVVELPRTSSDPPEGSVRLFLGDGTVYDNFWDRISNFLSDWEEAVR